LARYRRKVRVNEIDPISTVGAKPVGVTIPFNNPNGVFNQSYTNRVQVYSNLKNLLLTAKGERYMLPDFGTEIRYILFENISSEGEFVESIRNEISNAISTWMPYLTITELDVNVNVEDNLVADDPYHAVTIRLIVKITGTNIYLPIQIFISDTGSLTIEEAVYNG